MDRLQPPLENYANPKTCFFHVLFKAAALAFYILSALFFSSFVIIFVVTVLLAALDFWVVKNVSGRILVGLRWWNEINDQGESVWKFECLDQESLARMNKKDSWLFWWTIYLTVQSTAATTAVAEEGRVWSVWAAAHKKGLMRHRSGLALKADNEPKVNWISINPVQSDSNKIHIPSTNQAYGEPSESQGAFWFKQETYRAVAWIFLGIFLLIRFQADYLLVVGVCLTLSIANIVGFTKCQKDAKKQIQQFASQTIATRFSSTLQSAFSVV